MMKETDRLGSLYKKHFSSIKIMISFKGHLTIVLNVLHRMMIILIVIGEMMVLSELFLSKRNRYL
jgi:hypothetical protein